MEARTITKGTYCRKGNSMSHEEYQAALDRLNEAVLATTEQLKAVCREWNANRLAEGLPALPDRLLH